ncbi:pseudaminic acid synthase [Clostridium formicaceticum]|uniref:Pseudaminic acid synthase n=1 Tax=Clostridium formicaceticum TaxID=1497 RepID=A0AAC9RIK7_9CLOT|nr:pseudaminic acid synthase [Clostridium formicaceticum]AOY75667.1 pseudaminic acid synthase [Clostridium formicaceticum]ARE85983.1 Pseudaminic acid synthase [Clostridium formicaceticum]
MGKFLKIKNRLIGDKQPAYIIAEMSANHAGDISRAIEIIHAAKESGADCIKIQTYTADTITISSNKKYFQIEQGTWKNENLYRLYEKAYTPWEWHGKLKKEAEKVGLDFFSTPFDFTAVDFLEDLGVEFYKIASFELIDIPLIKYVASKGKPIIMSTGMGTLGEIEEAVRAVRSQGNEQLCLLKCSSEYPAIPDDMNLKTMQNISETFGVIVGLSDHSLGSIAAITAVAMGAKVIEKHFCMSRQIENPDASFSMEPHEFKKMVEDIRQVEKAIGTISYEVSEKEEKNRMFRKSIFAVKEVAKGEVFTKDNIRIIRPGNGLAPKYFDEIIGKYASEEIQRGTPLRWSMIK